MEDWNAYRRRQRAVATAKRQAETGYTRGPRPTHSARIRVPRTAAHIKAELDTDIAILLPRQRPNLLTASRFALGRRRDAMNRRDGRWRCQGPTPFLGSHRPG